MDNLGVMKNYRGVHTIFRDMNLVYTKGFMVVNIPAFSVEQLSSAGTQQRHN